MPTQLAQVAAVTGGLHDWLQSVADQVALIRQRQEWQRQNQIEAYLVAVEELRGQMQKRLAKLLGLGVGQVGELTIGLTPAAPVTPLNQSGVAEPVASLAARRPIHTEDKVTLVLGQTQRPGLDLPWLASLTNFWRRLTGKRLAGLGHARAASPFDFSQVQAIQRADGQVIVRLKAKTGNVLVDAMQEVNEWLTDLTPVRTRDLVTFYQLLAVMVNAGIPLLKALQQLVHQTRNMRLRKVIARLMYEIENGSSLSDAMDIFPNVFDDSQRGMVQAGEVSGSLTTILQRLADSLEKTDRIISKIRGAMMYPMFVMLVLIGVATILVVEVIPKLSELFTGAGIEMPATTKALIWLSAAVRGYWVLIILALILVVGAVITWLRTAWGRYSWHWLKLRLPIIGKMTRMVCIAKFSRGLGTLSSAGIAIVKNLKINADAIGNELYRRELLYTAESVKRGVTIAADLKQSRLFPPMVVNMIAVGEETAKLDEVSLKVADYYDQEIDTMVKGMTSIMEPVIIVAIGIMVAFVITAVMGPILKLGEVADTL